MQVVVTRPEPDGPSTVERLVAEGIDAVSIPLMAVRFEGTLPSIPPEGTLAFSSANGVRAYAAAGGPKDRAAVAVGEATATAARAVGLHVVGVASGDVDSLYRLLLTEGDGPILHVRGLHSRGHLVERLTAAGRRADAAAIYEAVAAPSLPGDFGAILRAPPAAVGFFSPRTARLFCRLAEDASPTIGTGSDLVAFCLSEAVAQEARAFPFGKVLTATAPTLPAFVDMVKVAVK